MMLADVLDVLVPGVGERDADDERRPCAQERGETRCVAGEPELCLDRQTAGYYSEEWSTASDIGLYSLIVGSTSLLLIDEGLLDGLNDLVVIAEAALSASAVSTVHAKP